MSRNSTDVTYEWCNKPCVLCIVFLSYFIISLVFLRNYQRRIITLQCSKINRYIQRSAPVLGLYHEHFFILFRFQFMIIWNIKIVHIKVYELTKFGKYNEKYINSLVLLYFHMKASGIKLYWRSIIFMKWNDSKARKIEIIYKTMLAFLK